jgi:hypothetical protein
MLLRARPAAPPGFVEPCLPSRAEQPPCGPDWVHEIKHDGYRLMARRDPAGVRLLFSFLAERPTFVGNPIQSCYNNDNNENITGSNAGDMSRRFLGVQCYT